MSWRAVVAAALLIAAMAGAAWVLVGGPPGPEAPPRPAAPPPAPTVLGGAGAAPPPPEIEPEQEGPPSRPDAPQARRAATAVALRFARAWTAYEAGVQTRGDRQAIVATATPGFARDTLENPPRVPLAGGPVTRGVIRGAQALDPAGGEVQVRVFVAYEGHADESVLSLVLRGRGRDWRVARVEP